MTRLFLIIMMMIALAACDSPQGSVTVTTDTILVQQQFTVDEVNNADFPVWDAFAIPLTNINFGISNGVYNAATSGGGYVWTLNHQTHNNVVIEVTASPEVASPNSIYGVICRAHPNNGGIGYYFLIRNDGYVGIRVNGGERNVPLVNWTESDAVRQNQANTLRVICVDDYLALYVNGQFVVETRHDWLSEGFAGFALNEVAGGSLAVTFDDMTIWSATIGE